MREGTIKYQFPLKKGMEHFPRKRKKLIFDSTRKFSVAARRALKQTIKDFSA
jgi:hypothetical protein